MEKKVVIGSKEYTVKEMSYLEALEINPEDKKGSTLKTLKACTGLSDEEIAKLTIREGLEIQQAINEVNGLTAFLKATEKN